MSPDLNQNFDLSFDSLSQSLFGLPLAINLNIINTTVAYTVAWKQILTSVKTKLNILNILFPKFIVRNLFIHAMPWRLST